MSYADDETERILRNMERRLKIIYSRATKETKDKLEKLMADFEAKDAEMERKVERGEITEAEHKKWRERQFTTNKRYSAMVETLAEDYTNVDKLAMSVVNGYMPDVYALNRNFSTYDIEKGSNLDTNFTLYNRATVEKLVKENSIMLPHPRVDIPKDMRWNKRHIRAEITQGVLQGESIPKIAKRLQNVTNMNHSAAVRNARTAVTGAQNGARIDTYKAAKEKGIGLQQRWISTLDMRTRHSHAVMDNETVEVGALFSNGLRFPGDPQGDPAEVYNCRCRMVGHLTGFNFSDAPRNNKLGDMSYDDWMNMHRQALSKPKQEKLHHVIAQGKDISQTWKRRPNQFDFEIEDVLNAQGFDGMPRVVPPEEFDQLVKEANNENGFIAQRTYSAPDQETLDAYRDQLYNGKWYVDCSTGGAQYGQGMYCAADYTGKLTDGIKNEMEHYQELGTERFGKKWRSYDMMNEKEQKSDDLYDEMVSLGYSPYKSYAKESKIYKLMQERERLDNMDVLEYVKEYHKDFLAQSYIETMTLDPSAKVVTYNDLMKSFEEEYGFSTFPTPSSWKTVVSTTYNFSNGSGAFQKLTKEEQESLVRNAIIQSSVPTDAGSYAALKGYDVINAEGHGESGSYTVILNRTKVIFRGE